MFTPRHRFQMEMLFLLVVCAELLWFFCANDAEPIGPNQTTTLEPVLNLDTTRVEHTFEFRNTTGRDLLLKKPLTGCGCTSATLVSCSLKKGGLGKLTMLVTLSPSDNGTKSLRATVQSESGEQWQFHLIIPIVRRIVVPEEAPIGR